MLSASTCPNDYRWTSGLENVGHYRGCALQKTLSALPVGACQMPSSSEIVCTPNPESCRGGEWLGPALDCQVTTTLYGACGGSCRYAPPSDCGNDWIFPHNDCDCTQVRVGACRDETGLFVCAVDAQACSAQEEWLTVEQVTQELLVECYLCREPSKEGVNPFEEDPREASTGINKDPTRDTRDVTIRILAVGVGVALVMLVVSLLVFRRNKNEKKEGKGGNEESSSSNTTPPINALEMETDDISVVSVL